MARIAVVIPVGPAAHHAEWLRDAWDSVLAQTRLPESIIVVDDMHGRDLDLEVERWYRGRPDRARTMNTMFETPLWRLGVGTAFNWGIAAAFNTVLWAEEGTHDLALCFGADDRLQPRVIEQLEQTYEQQGRRDGYYWCEVEYQDGTQQALPCNNAALTPGFFRRTGGYPVEAAAGGMDAALISAMLVHDPDSLIRVQGAHEARFWSRQHEHQESARLNQFGAAPGMIREVITANYRPTDWGRYE